MFNTHIFFYEVCMADELTYIDHQVGYFIDFNALKLNASLKRHKDNNSEAVKEYHTETLENDLQYDDTTGITQQILADIPNPGSSPLPIMTITHTFATFTHAPQSHEHEVAVTLDLIGIQLDLSALGDLRSECLQCARPATFTSCIDRHSFIIMAQANILGFLKPGKRQWGVVLETNSSVWAGRNRVSYYVAHSRFLEIFLIGLGQRMLR